MGHAEKKYKRKPLPASEIGGKLIDSVWWVVLDREQKVEETNTAEGDDSIAENSLISFIQYHF